MMRDEQKKVLADKIASLLQGDSGIDGNEQIWRAIDELGRRLEQVELSIGGSSPAGVIGHPSLETYALPEATSAGGSEEKTCSFEPHNRICDHCSLCSSRGF